MSHIRSITTRQSILDAAVTEFFAHGYKGASVRDICARAGASSNAITYHFGSKESVYREILDRFAALLLEQTRSALSGEMRSQEEFEIRLEMFLAQLLETYLSNREIVLIAIREFEQLLPESDDSAIREMVGVSLCLSSFVQKAKDQGFVREDIDASIVAGTLMDRLTNQARFAHTHERFFNVTSLDPEYRAYWVRASLGLVLEGMKPRADPQNKGRKDKTMHIEHTIEINAPVDLVWSKISNLADIQNWTKAVKESHFHTEITRGIGAGRTCDVPGFGKLVENVLEWDEGKSFRLSLEGLPFFIKEASGGWRLEELGPNRTRGTTSIDLQTRFWPLGALMEKIALAPQFHKTIKGAQREFKAYVEGSAEVPKTAPAQHPRAVA